jgi:two-component system LytT family sensor kinase
MLAFMSILCMIHGIIALVIKGFINWYGDIKVKEALKQQNFETEMALIKSQLNPHFLFNTINNIDVLIEKDATKASPYLNKLSDIMRFMLYEAKTDTIPLDTELAYISKYIDLQKIRNANKAFVQFDISGSAGSLRIAPMLFVPFIENAFKHTTNKKEENAIVVRIDIKEKQLEFYCRNSFAKNHLNNEEAGGLGNELITKRLNLLYPGRHQLRVSEDKEEYVVKLTIEVA